MSLPHSRAPHTMGVPVAHPEAPNAALLIDFDNVTMGMRSDLSKELKNLLNSDIIKGKVTVQRAYADWRRYPQYIVPLSENSVDLIFAPAYGSSKKNATDIRMAIDGMELVFIRPEIGTFILLTGDSDFSSLVLKLKEYGKYVIGVGIQESSSDILVQNCDEYYSYTSLTGLRKTTDSANKAVDPWVLVEQAVQKMSSRNDVMRSDRLKQVMIEIDPTFDEGNFGFSKFSRFLSDAASRDLVDLRKLENGQYEVRPKSGGREEGSRDRGGSHRRGDERSRSKERERDERPPQPRGQPREQPEKGNEKAPKDAPEAKPAGAPRTAPDGVDPLQAAYGLLRKALAGLSEGNGGGAVRDSDLKRKMLELEPSFDEGDLGFGKFTRFLRQAHDHEVVDLEKREEGTYQVALRPTATSNAAGASGPAGKAGPSGAPESKATASAGSKVAPDGTLPEEEFGKQAAARASVVKGLGPRRGERKGRRGKDGPPPLLEGQVVSRGAAVPSQDKEPPKEEVGGKKEEGAAIASRTPRSRKSRAAGKAKGSQEKAGGEGSPRSPEAQEAPSRAPGGEVGPARLGLPTEGAAIISYLTNSYKGVGKKTAESLVEAFGSDLFSVLENEPDRIGPIVSGKRAEQLLEGWKADARRRSGRATPEAAGQAKPAERGAEAAPDGEAPGEAQPAGTNPPASRRRTRRGGRSRKG